MELVIDAGDDLLPGGDDGFELDFRGLVRAVWFRCGGGFYGEGGGGLDFTALRIGIGEAPREGGYGDCADREGDGEEQRFHVRLSQKFGRLHELGDAVEESARATAIEDAVIEAEGEFGSGAWEERLAVIVPDGLADTGSEAEDEILFRERNGSGPEDSEGAEIGDGGDAEAAGFRWQAAVACGGDELAVGSGQFRERLPVDVADDGDEDAVGYFHGEAEVDGFGVNDAFAHEASGGCGILREGEREGAHGVEGGTGPGFRLTPSVIKEGVEGHGDADRGEGSGP